MGRLTDLAHATRRLARGHPRLHAAPALAAGLQACAYPYYAGPLRPAPSQAEQVQVADDGTVTYVRDRLEISLRPLTDEELNRQFESQSQAGPRSTNPYTYGNALVGAYGQTPARFTVFRLGVKNYAYPKVRIDPARIVLRATNGRRYWALGLDQLHGYFRAYAIGYRGNEYSQYQERLDVLQRTLFSAEPIFSGQERSGYLVFPVLHPDVRELAAQVRDAVLRFDFRDEPVETAEVAYQFVRDIGRVTPAGIKLVP
ncbi:MAG: hypothetical protein AB1505_00530 [Candidatus Latescibacterota bacterium]